VTAFTTTNSGCNPPSVVSQAVRVVPAGIIPYGTQGSTLRALALGSAGPPSNPVHPVHLIASSLTPLRCTRCLLYTPLML
jgi:hypothetical protein